MDAADDNQRAVKNAVVRANRCDASIARWPREWPDRLGGRMGSIGSQAPLPAMETVGRTQLMRAWAHRTETMVGGCAVLEREYANTKDKLEKENSDPSYYVHTYIVVPRLAR